eukprot:12122203-Alexandrium_andersonii.AAC.1
MTAASPQDVAAAAAAAAAAAPAAAACGQPAMHGMTAHDASIVCAIDTPTFRGALLQPCWRRRAAAAAKSCRRAAAAPNCSGAWHA